MRAVVQRVLRASVKVNGEVTGEIDSGLLVLTGFAATDTIDEIKWFSNKLVNLRVFNDENQKMNKSVIDINGSLLIVSNFTVYGDAARGFRPSYSHAAAADYADKLYSTFIEYLRSNFAVKIETGIFQAMMAVELVNDGPVTIILEKERVNYEL